MISVCTFYIRMLHAGTGTGTGTAEQQHMRGQIQNGGGDLQALIFVAHTAGKFC